MTLNADPQASSLIHAGGDAVGERDRIARREWFILGGVCLVALAYWIIHYHPFVLPNSDFSSFERTAQRLWAGEPPGDFKRMPLFPLLFGLVAHAVPAERPDLHAALGLNIAFSLGILVMSFLLGRRLIGPAAFVPTIVLLFMPEFHTSATQPLVEPSLTFLILLSLLLYTVGSRWQYLAAGLAAITRYEASALIAIFFILNVITERRLWLHLLLSALASIGFLLWMTLSLLEHSSGNPYLEQMSGQGFALAWPVVETMVRQLADGSVYTWVGLPLAVFGVIISLRRFPFPSIAILGFTALYTGAHVAFGVDKEVYAHPVQWVTPFYITVGVLPALERLRPKPDAPPWPRSTIIGIIALTLALAGLALGLELHDLRDVTGLRSPLVYLGFLAAIWVLLAAVGMLGVRRPRETAFVFGIALAAGVTLLGTDALAWHIADVRRTCYAKYEVYAGTKWLADHLEPDERALVFTTIAVPATSISFEQLVCFDELEAETHDELIAELIARDVDYVVYWYRPGKPTDPAETNYERHLYYYYLYKVWLADPFKRGEPVPGFEHVATIPIPEFLREPDVQVYRFLGDDPGVTEPRPTE